MKVIKMILYHLLGLLDILTVLSLERVIVTHSVKMFISTLPALQPHTRQLIPRPYMVNQFSVRNITNTHKNKIFSFYLESIEQRISANRNLYPTNRDNITTGQDRLTGCCQEKYGKTILQFFFGVIHWSDCSSGFRDMISLCFPSLFQLLEDLY